MTKIATMQNRRFMSLVVAAALVLATMMALIVPTAARAATSEVSGGFTVNNGTFAVDNVTVLTTTDNSVATSITPNTNYYVKVSVTDQNGLDNVTQVNVILFWESDGSYSAGDQNNLTDNVQTHATFKWTPSGDFVLVGPTSDNSTWTCDNSSSIEPSSFSVTQDYFEFRTHIGNVATYAPASGGPRWFAYASAANGSSTPSNASSGLTMQWYGAITADAGAGVTWSGAAPGTGYTKAGSDVSVNYIANGAYTKSAGANSPWSGANLVNSDTPGANQFALRADDQNSDYAIAPNLVSTGYTAIGTGTQTSEAGVTDTSGVWLKIGSPFTAGSYNGTISFQISNP